MCDERAACECRQCDCDRNLLGGGGTYALGRHATDGHRVPGHAVRQGVPGGREMCLLKTIGAGRRFRASRRRSPPTNDGARKRERLPNDENGDGCWNRSRRAARSRRFTRRRETTMARCTKLRCLQHTLHGLRSVTSSSAQYGVRSAPLRAPRESRVPAARRHSARPGRRVFPAARSAANRSRSAWLADGRSAAAQRAPPTGEARSGRAALFPRKICRATRSQRPRRGHVGNARFFVNIGRWSASVPSGGIFAALDDSSRGVVTPPPSSPAAHPPIRPSAPRPSRSQSGGG